MTNFSITHPFEPDLSFLYGTIFTGPPRDPSHHSRNVCIFADGELDRSATGSGVSARAALHFAKGELGLNERITIESILGSTMSVKVVKLRNLDHTTLLYLRSAALHQSSVATSSISTPKIRSARDLFLDSYVSSSALKSSLSACLSAGAGVNPPRTVEVSSIGQSAGPL